MKLAFLFIFICLSALARPRHHQCAPLTYNFCMQEFALICPQGYTDGCLTGETQKHRCVAVKGGPSCELDLWPECPQSFQDGCITGETKTHRCVPIMGPDCRADVDWECPSGFMDICKSRWNFGI